MTLAKRNPTGHIVTCTLCKVKTKEYLMAHIPSRRNKGSTTYPVHPACELILNKHVSIHSQKTITLKEASEVVQNILANKAPPGMTFTEAVEAMTDGKKITRAVWLKKNYWSMNKYGIITFKDGTPAKINDKQVLVCDDFLIYGEETDVWADLMKKLEVSIDTTPDSHKTLILKAIDSLHIRVKELEK